MARARHHADRPGGGEPLPVRGDGREARLHARGRDREHRHRRPVDGALGGEEPPRRHRARRSRRLRGRARRAARRRRRASRSRPTPRLARKAFRATARYDGAIADYLGARAAPRRRFGETLHIGAAQGAGPALRREPAPAGARSTATSSRVVEQLHGKELSYNNIVDINAALALMLEFVADADAAVAILKHNTPCGVGTGASVARGLPSAPSRPIPSRRSAASSIANQPWTLELARGRRRDLHRGADRARLRARRARVPAQEEEPPPDALAPASDATAARATMRSVVGGLLVQDADRAMEDPRAAQVVTQRAADRRRAARRCAFGLEGRQAREVERHRVRRRPTARWRSAAARPRASIRCTRRARRPARVGISLHGSVLGERRVLPVPRRRRGGGRGRRDRHRAARRQRARRRGDRRRRRARRGDGLHRRAALPALRRVR